MKYLVISLCVKVTGPPFLICLLNNGITEPLLPSTFPNLTATNSVLFPLSWLTAWTIISQSLFVAPITLVGFTALSVEIKTNFSTLYWLASCAIFNVPITLFFIASDGLSSIKGTCLCAAAWNIIFGLYALIIWFNLALSLTDAIITFLFNSGSL